MAGRAPGPARPTTVPDHRGSPGAGPARGVGRRRTSALLLLRGPFARRGDLVFQRGGDLPDLRVGAGTLQLVAEFVQFGAAGHQAGELVAGDLALGVVADAAAAVQDEEAVADRVGVVWVVADEDDAEPAIPGLDDVAEYDAGLFDAECGG